MGRFLLVAALALLGSVAVWLRADRRAMPRRMHVVLRLLAKHGPSYGRELALHLEGRGASANWLYVALRRLERLGYIRVTTGVGGPERGRPRLCYELTGHGRGAVTLLRVGRDGKAVPHA